MASKKKLSETMRTILAGFNRAPIKRRGEYSDGAGHVLILDVDHYDQRSFNACVSRRLVEFFRRCACKHPCTCQCNGWHITADGVAELEDRPGATRGPRERAGTPEPRAPTRGGPAPSPHRVKLRVKIGTHASDILVIRKRKPPEVGEVFEARRAEPGAKYERYQCTEIRDVFGPFYFVERS